MLPFCGYNMGDYFQHWLDMGDKLKDKAPEYFYVNWFRKSSDGKCLWPGFGENSRALKWMCERVDGKAGGRKTAIGYLPNDTDLDLRGLNVAPENINELLGSMRQPGSWKSRRWRNSSRNSATACRKDCAINSMS